MLITYRHFAGTVMIYTVCVCKSDWHGFKHLICNYFTITVRLTRLRIKSSDNVKHTNFIVTVFILALCAMWAHNCVCHKMMHNNAQIHKISCILSQLKHFITYQQSVVLAVPALLHQSSGNSLPLKPPLMYLQPEIVSHWTTKYQLTCSRMHKHVHSFRELL